MLPTEFDSKCFSVANLSTSALCYFGDRSERRLRGLENDESTVETFGDVLLRESTRINPNVASESVRGAVKDGDLSWAMFGDQIRDVAMQRLGAIADLDKSQCSELFDKMHRIRSIEDKTKRRGIILEMARILYQKWIMKCMCNLSE